MLSKVSRLVASTPGYHDDGVRQFSFPGIMQVWSAILIVALVAVGVSALLIKPEHEMLATKIYWGILSVALAALMFLLVIRPTVGRERDWELGRWLNRHTCYHLSLVMLSAIVLRTI